MHFIVGEVNVQRSTLYLNFVPYLHMSRMTVARLPAILKLPASCRRHARCMPQASRGQCNGHVTGNARWMSGSWMWIECGLNVWHKSSQWRKARSRVCAFWDWESHGVPLPLPLFPRRGRGDGGKRLRKILYCEWDNVWHVIVRWTSREWVSRSVLGRVHKLNDADRRTKIDAVLGCEWLRCFMRQISSDLSSFLRNRGSASETAATALARGTTITSLPFRYPSTILISGPTLCTWKIQFRFSITRSSEFPVWMVIVSRRILF